MDAQSKEIAELKEKLKQSEARYISLMDHTTDGICLLDLDESIIEVNSGICEMLGYTSGELLNLKVSDLIDPEQLRVDPLFKSGIEVKKNIVRERTFVRKDKKLVDVEINMKLVRENQGIAIIRNITGRKKMERELREAELKFRTIAEHSLVGIYIVMEGKFSYVNPRFAEVFGYTPLEMIETFPVEEIFQDNYQPVATEHVRARIAGEVKSVHYEAMGKRKDGGARWVEFYGSGTTINEKPCIIGSMIDITERRQAEEEIIRSQANLQTILDTTDTAYALFDKELCLLAFNQMLFSFINNQYQLVPQKGDCLEDYFPQEKFPQLNGQVMEVLKGTSISYEINYPRPDNSKIWFYVRLFPIKNENDEIFGLMLALDDITSRKDAENKLTDAYLQIQDQVNHIREMTWKQSHLIRSPIANLKGLVSLLMQDPVDIESLNYIHEELRRLDDIIIEMAETRIDSQAS